MSLLDQLMNRLRKAVFSAEQKRSNPEVQEQAVSEVSDQARPEEILSGSCGENMTWKLQDGTLFVTGKGTLCHTDEIKSIRKQIKHLVIEKGCTVIDGYAFWDCETLIRAEIPDTVTEIRKYAFWACSSLSEITLPPSLNTIGEFAFAGCSALTALTLPDSVAVIEKRAFDNIPCTLYHNAPHRFLFPFRKPFIAMKLFSCNGFQYVCGCNDNLFGTYIEPSGGFIDGNKPEISYPEGAVITGYMGHDAEVVIPPELDGHPVVGIARDVFSRQTQLRRVSMAEGIVRIGVEAFAECGNLQSVHFPESLEMIDGGAFYNTGLTELSLPAKLRKIGQLAFSGTLITEVILPEKLEILGDDAFLECPQLQKVYIPAEIECFVDAQAEDGWPMDLIYVQFGPDLDDDGNPTVGSGDIRTFADCPKLTEVDDRFGLNQWQKGMMFEGTPWLKEQEAMQNMLRILKEHSRVIPGKEKKRVPLLLNPQDIQAAKLYTPNEIAALLERLSCDAPYRASTLIVNFSEKDAVSEYMSWNDYWLKWEYNGERQSVPTLILNFAGTHRPDASQFPLAYGQEKSLLENSTLLATLKNTQAKAFYLFQQAVPDEIRSDAMLLSPFVEFFSVNGVQQEKSQLAAVLSVAPPRASGNPKAVAEVLERRIRAMLLVAAKEGYKRLILGAWGCGSAGNDPELVASIFEKVLRKQVSTFNSRGKEQMHTWNDFFDSVTFAVPSGSASEAFKHRFSDFHRIEREARHNRIREKIASDREKYLSAIKGSLIGGAVGDALGYPVEFMSYKGIIKQYGEAGIRHYEKDPVTGVALVSDDTQMTLFTATGMMVGETRAVMRGVAGPMESYIYESYRDWYFCQCDTSMPDKNGEWHAHGNKWNISWLSYLPEMHDRRAPGNTCLNALGSGDSGTMEDRINDSKGCGGVVRVAPVALYLTYLLERPREQLKNMCFIAAKAAALTHGHPLGYMPAAALAHIIFSAAFGGCPYGNSLHDILKECAEMMQDMFGSESDLPKMLSLMERAEVQAANDKSDAENIESLGGGWVAEEALAIAIYCCLRYPDDFSKAVIAAVNHSGDSDSTGAITGNIMGAWLGYEKIDPEWLKDLELCDVIEEVANDLCDHCRMSEFSDYRDVDWERKYIKFGKFDQ